jgi:pimeloyl-ACP methyl ester carboxylesterase
MIQIVRGSGSGRTVIAMFLLVVASTVGCATPIGVRPANPTDVTRALNRNILTTGELSDPTRTLLHLTDLKGAYKADPKAVLDELHLALVEQIEAKSSVVDMALATMAELAFDYATRSGDRRYFLSSTVYAWAYLFPSDGSRSLDAFDPKVQLALGIYNRGLSSAFKSKDMTLVSLASGDFETSFGSVNIRLDESTITRGPYQLYDFINVADLEIRGLTNRYRNRGLGAPLAAAVRTLDPNAPPPAYVPKKLRVPCTGILFFDDVEAQIVTGAMTGEIKVAISWERDSTEVDGKTYPLELETSSSLALMLAESSPWETELKGFFQGDLATASSEGLFSLEPYHPDRIPVVLVHGTASSSARWANMLNDLSNDPRIRSHFQFWMFDYNTGNPIAYSAFLLRESIRDLVQAIDPTHQDGALKQMIVIGHSQGGLLTKLTGIDTGESFWNLYSDIPPDEIKLSDESRRIFEGSLLVTPLPEVERLIYISTPHRGSYLAAYGPARWLGSLVRSPANLVNLSIDVISSNPESQALRSLGKARGSVGEMSPESDFLETMIDIPTSSDIRAHSIIALRGWSPELDEAAKEKLKKRGSDGVVKYESAHIDDVESEFIVDSGHSCQDNPLVIGEVRRILFEHIDSEETTFNPRRRR